MRFHRFCWSLAVAALAVPLASVPTAAADQPAAQPEAAPPDSQLDLPREIPKSGEAMLARITELIRESLRAEPSQDRAVEAVFRARQIWRDSIQRAENAEVIAARDTVEEIRKAQAFLEDLQRGSPMELLGTLRERDVHPFELVGDREAYARLFQRHVGGPTIDWQEWDPSERLPDGAVLRIPAGVCRADGNFLSRTRPFPRDVVVQGSGMDETLLRLNGEIAAGTEVYGLTLRDLTIDCGDNYLTRMRSAPAIIHMERCRVIGFDMGAGGSEMLSGGTIAFWAEDCSFEAGFGRSPGSGNLFDVRSGLLARLDRCTIRGPFSSVCYHFDATQVFSNCRLLDMSEHARTWLEGRREGVRFENCEMTYLTRDQEWGMRTGERRPLTELNPDWVVEPRGG
jgi:hypothetical protein